MTIYLTLPQFWVAAHAATNLPTKTLIAASRTDLADSALHAPQAGFGDTDFYPSLAEKAAVLCCRIAWNHPLPDGNKRTAWICMAVFLEMNGATWHTDPDFDDAVAFMLAVAAHEIDEAEAAEWIAARIAAPDDR